MTMNRNECARWLLSHDHFAILTHSAPDGDTLGSAAALCRGLRALGKTAWVLENGETPEHLAYLCEGLTCPLPEEGATLISVDAAAPHMFPEPLLQYVDRIALRIDHHGRSTSFTPLELVDPASGACAEIIYDLLTLLEVEITPEIAIPMYTGTATDTGCFRYANTTAHTFTVAAACAASGANLQPINQALFDTVSLSKLRVQAWVTEHTVFHCGGSVAVCSIPLRLSEELGVSEEETGGMSGFVRSIEGVRMAATLRESEDGKVYISLRAGPGYDCGTVCQKFGGGGHKGAAGAGSDLPLAEITALLTDAMIAHFEEVHERNCDC